MNVPYYLTIDKGLVHFGSEVRKISYKFLSSPFFTNLLHCLQPFAMNMAVNADFHSNEEIMKIYEKLKSPGLYSTQTYLVAFGVLCMILTP